MEGSDRNEIALFELKEEVSIPPRLTTKAESADNRYGWVNLYSSIIVSESKFVIFYLNIYYILFKS